MKKIDLHIHTISTISDRNFTFSLEHLKEYVESKGIDAIAITNHNLFNREQYKEIVNALNCNVFPGIEVDIECGHLLVISDCDDINDFEKGCETIKEMNGNRADCSISENAFINSFPNYNKYLLIPHYDKDPKLDLDRIPNLREYLYCGEVTSAKKFLSLKKQTENLVPVLFSDFRCSTEVTTFPDRQTYVDIEEVSLSSLKYALKDNSKVSLSSESGHIIFEVLDNGLCISNGLTVILGKRSSGKTYTLDRISEQFEHAKYIKQFSLLSTDEVSDQKRFEQKLSNKSSSVAENFLTHFKEVVEEITNIDLDSDDISLDNYLNSLLQAASEFERKDIFAKCRLFNETCFLEKNLNVLEDLIDSVELILNNKEYINIIEQFVSRKNLISLSISLMKKFIEENEYNMKIQYVNNIVENIKNELRILSTNTPIYDVDFYKILINKTKVAKFEKIVNLLKQDRLIEQKDLYSYKVIARATPFLCAQDMHKIAKTRMSFSDSFVFYDEPYLFLQKLKNIGELPTSDFYKCFVDIKYEVLNKYEKPVSGGERSEFNLLQELIDAGRSDILLLDEPESSFDNLFLKDGVNKILKNLSKDIPVVIATHNNTIGASVHPDYLIYTEKEITKDCQVKYRLFSGYPSNTELVDLEGKKIKRRDVVLDCLEAGEQAYNERRDSYEISSD